LFHFYLHFHLLLPASKAAVIATNRVPISHPQDGSWLPAGRAAKRERRDHVPDGVLNRSVRGRRMNGQRPPLGGPLDIQFAFVCFFSAPDHIAFRGLIVILAVVSFSNFL
jgi:hypothetical protein